MKLVISQNIGNDGLVMNFEQIRKTLTEIYYGKELFIVVFSDKHRKEFMQVRTEYVENYFAIQMRISTKDNFKMYEKSVQGFQLLEKYFCAFYNNESWLCEDLHKWLDITDDTDPDNNIEQIGEHHYHKSVLNEQEIMEVFHNMKDDNVIILKHHHPFSLKIHLYQEKILYLYQLHIEVGNEQIGYKFYDKTSGDIEFVKDIIQKYISNQPIDFENWQVRG